MEPSTERTWLVKSAGIVMGPYSLEELINALDERKISLIDEVRDPKTRWSFLREHSRFKEIVQMLRDRQQTHREDTNTTFVGTKTVTQTNTIELTKTPVMDEADDLTARDVEEVSEPVSKKATSYGSANDRRFQKTVSKQSQSRVRAFWIVAVVVIAVAGVAIFKIQDSTQRPLTFLELTDLAQKQAKIGMYEKALQTYRRAQDKGKLNPSLRLEMANLLMVVENQNLAARQMVEEILPELKTQELEDQAENFLATSYLRDGNLDEAQKRFDYILEKEPDNKAAEMNSITLQILQGQFESALSRIAEIPKKGTADPTLSLYRALIHYHLGTTDSDVISKTISDLKRYIQNTWDYRIEALLILAGIQKRKGDELEMVSTLQQLLTTSPDLTKNHIHNFQVHREVLQWSYLANFCDMLLNGAAESPLMGGLRSFCSYQKNDFKLAMDEIEKMRNQYPQEPILMGLHSFLLFKLDRFSEAKALTTVSSDKEPLVVEVKGSLCEREKDWNCAESIWQSILKKNPSALRAMEGVARIAKEKGQIEKSNDLVRRGLLISSNYRPFIELQEKWK